MNTDTASELSARLTDVEAILDTAAASIPGFDPDELGQTMTVLRRLQHRIDATIACVAQRAAELEATGDGPGVDQTLLGTGQVSAKQARTEAARPGVMDRFPLLGRGWQSGAIGTEQLDAVGRAHERLTDDERPALLALDTDLAKQAASSPPETFHRWLWTRINRDIRQDGGGAELEQQRADSRVTWWTDHTTGMGHISATLDPLRWETITNTLNTKMRALANKRDDEVSLDAHLAADAFTELLLADPAQRQARRAGTQLTVIVDANTLLNGYHPASIHETSNGTPLPRQTIDRLACDATIRRVTLDQRGVPTDVGRQHRTATPAQWAALQALYRTCAWSGCDRPIGWCEAHHIVEWNDDGLTDLDNLIPLCSKHHHHVHEGGWGLQLNPDRTLHIHQPDDALWRTTRPDRAAPSDDRAAPAKRDRHRPKPSARPPKQEPPASPGPPSDSTRLKRESSQATPHEPATISA